MKKILWSSLVLMMFAAFTADAGTGKKGRKKTGTQKVRTGKKCVNRPGCICY